MRGHDPPLGFLVPMNRQCRDTDPEPTEPSTREIFAALFPYEAADLAEAEKRRSQPPRAGRRRSFMEIHHLLVAAAADQSRQAGRRAGARARSSRGSASRTRGSRRTSGSRAGPDDDGGGESADPEPGAPELELSGRGAAR